MNILFYSPVNLQNGGGCERWHCDITNSLKHQYGHNISIATGNLGDSKWSNDYLIQQLNTIPYQVINFPIVFHTLIPTPAAFWRLLKLIQQVDAVHFIYGFMGQDILMAIIKLFTGKKFIVGHHAPTFHTSRVHNWYMRYVSRYLMSFFDYHQVLNASDKNFFENNWHIKNVHFIPSGIQIDRFLHNQQVSHTPLRFLSVGRYEIQKGFDLQLEAINHFNQLYPKNSAEFYFVGGGAQKPLIQDYASRNSNIIDLGYVEYEKIPQLYSQSDVYLLCSREEPFGLVLIEAWSSGLPVLATKTEGPKDMLMPNRNGWFIEGITTSDIVKSLSGLYKRWLTSRDVFKKYSPACYRTGKLYSIDQTASLMHHQFFSHTTV